MKWVLLYCNMLKKVMHGNRYKRCLTKETRLLTCLVADHENINFTTNAILRLSQVDAKRIDKTRLIRDFISFYRYLKFDSKI